MPMIKVTVKLFGDFRRRLADPNNSGEAEFLLPPGSTVKALLAELGLEEDSESMAILVDGTTATGQRELHDGAQVAIFPPYEGG